MSIRLKVSCINKQERFSPNERIKNIGGIHSDGSRWKLTEDAAIKSIKNGDYSFYVSFGHYEVNVIIATHNGHEYLRTVPDATGIDKLLNLPECQ